MRQILSFAVVVLFVSSVGAQAQKTLRAEGTVKEDLFPDADGSLGLWHIGDFTVETDLLTVSKTHTFTLLWDNEGTGVLLSVVRPSDETILVLSTGNDRKVTAEVSLMAGKYQLIIVGVVEPTHYHLNATVAGDVVGWDEEIETETNTFSAARAAVALRIEEILAPRAIELEAAVRR